jgi:hypothetical protein
VIHLSFKILILTPEAVDNDLYPLLFLLVISWLPGVLVLVLAKNVFFLFLLLVIIVFILFSLEVSLLFFIRLLDEVSTVERGVHFVFVRIDIPLMRGSGVRSHLCSVSLDLKPARSLDAHSEYRLQHLILLLDLFPI